MPPRLSVYFDGQCPLCSREINHYRRRTQPEVVEYVDISRPEFDAEALGFDKARVNKHMHARLDGQLFVGVDAFRAMWSLIPGFRWLRRLTGLPGVYQASKVLYVIFAWVRPFMNRKRQDCSSGQCRV